MHVKLGKPFASVSEPVEVSCERYARQFTSQISSILDAVFLLVQDGIYIVEDVPLRNRVIVIV